MLPLATIHSMFLAPVNQTRAHNPNQRTPQRHLTLQTFPLLAFNQLITVYDTTIHSSQTANFTKF